MSKVEIEYLSDDKQHIVIKSPDGSGWIINIDDSGNLTTTKL